MYTAVQEVCVPKKNQYRLTNLGNFLQDIFTDETHAEITNGSGEYDSI